MLTIITIKVIIEIKDFAQTMMQKNLLPKGRHVRKDCPVWKCICEEETIGTKPKVGVNVVMVDWDQP